jgi:NAD(P)-dependent dehydrogenase (short-subunit alcohol dehydrogenase family)
MSPAGGVVIRRMTTLLTDKHAIIYGGGGSLGGGIARTFAREGATVHLAGRTREPLERVAADIAAAGGRAEVAVPRRVRRARRRRARGRRPRAGGPLNGGQAPLSKRGQAPLSKGA